MFNWVRRLLETNMGQSRVSMAAPPTYADITLSILSSHNNQTKQIRYLDAVPTSLGDINFESTASGSEFITFNASFRFTYFELV